MKVENEMLIVETREELEELIEWDVAWLGERQIKFDLIKVTIVVTWADRFWKVSYERSDEVGVRWYGRMYCPEVELREVVRREWIEKGRSREDLSEDVEVKAEDASEKNGGVGTPTQPNLPFEL